MKILKGIIVVVIATIFWGIWRFSIPIFDTIPPTTLSENLEASWFVAMNLRQPVLLLFATLVMAGLVYFFTLIQGGLSRSKSQKGFLYGLFFGGLWYIGFIGISLFFDTPLQEELINGIADALPLTLAGWLAGMILGDAGKPLHFWPPQALLRVSIMALVFTVVHSSTYFFADHNHINARILLVPTEISQVLIVIVVGIWLGIMLGYLKDGLPNQSRIKNALLFAVGIFGYNWIAFNIFYNIYFASILIPTLAVAFLDIFAVFLGFLLVDKFMALEKG